MSTKAGTASMVANDQLQYMLQNQDLKITYLASGFQGLPYLTYQDQTQTLNFKGVEIRAAETEIGSLVTVTIKLTVDAGSTSFSVLIPAITLVDMQATEVFKTVGVLTVHKTGLAGPPLSGARETYEVWELDGSAHAVEVPLGAETAG
jgi:hypothetical protein